MARKKADELCPMWIFIFHSELIFTIVTQAWLKSDQLQNKHGQLV